MCCWTYRSDEHISDTQTNVRVNHKAISILCNVYRSKSENDFQPTGRLHVELLPGYDELDFFTEYSLYRNGLDCLSNGVLTSPWIPHIIDHRFLCGPPRHKDDLKITQVKFFIFFSKVNQPVKHSLLQSSLSETRSFQCEHLSKA